MEFQLRKRQQQQIALANIKSSAELMRVQSEFKKKHEQVALAELAIKKLLAQVVQIQTLQTSALTPELHQNFIQHAIALNENLLIAQDDWAVKKAAFAAVQRRVEQYLNQQQVFGELQQKLQFQLLNVISDYQDQTVMDLAAGARK
jgi:hypothetical protein